jgi:caffeoyl-CoA O-methyltransferase
VAHVRPGGVIAAHNALRHGAVLNPETEGDWAMHRFNEAVARHPRLVSSIIAIGDGMLVAVLNSER